MTWFDLIVLGLMALSILFATLRGFSREVTTLVALAIGAVAAIWLSGPVGGFIGAASSLMKNMMVIVALFVVFFFASLIGLNMAVRHLISHQPGRIDRAIGAVFGFLRGWLLVGLGYLALDYYFEADRRPEGITNAATLGFARTAADLLESMGLETVSSSTAQTSTRDGKDFAAALPTD